MKTLTPHKGVKVPLPNSFPKYTKRIYKVLLLMILTMLFMMPMATMATMAQAETYHKSFPFDLHGCKRHLKAIAKAVKDAGGKVKKNDGSDRSYRMTLDGTTTIYTCTRHELLETEI